PDFTQTFTLNVTPAPQHISITSPTTPYTQNFDSLTSNTWSNEVTLPGWSLYAQPAPGTPITTIAQSNGSTNAGSFYSFGATGSGDRALGGIGSGSAYFGSPGGGSVAGWIVAALTNNTGSTVSGVTVAFDGEQWRDGGSSGFTPAAQTMSFEYGFGSDF